MRPDDFSAEDSAHRDAPLGTAQVRSRSNLLPEETVGGSDDPEAQAKIILEDSERRTDDPTASPTTFVEHRSSEDAL